MMELSISGIPTNELWYIPLQGVTKVQSGCSAYKVNLKRLKNANLLFLTFVFFLNIWFLSFYCSSGHGISIFTFE